MTVASPYLILEYLRGKQVSETPRTVDNRRKAMTSAWKHSNAYKSRVVIVVHKERVVCAYGNGTRLKQFDGVRFE